MGLPGGRGYMPDRACDQAHLRDHWHHASGDPIGDPTGPASNLPRACKLLNTPLELHHHSTTLSPLTFPAASVALASSSRLEGGPYFLPLPFAAGSGGSYAPPICDTGSSNGQLEARNSLHRVRRAHALLRAWHHDASRQM
jgi:hypothetical protein